MIQTHTTDILLLLRKPSTSSCALQLPAHVLHAYANQGLPKHKQTLQGAVIRLLHPVQHHEGPQQGLPKFAGKPSQFELTAAERTGSCHHIIHQQRADLGVLKR
jgi:hypothetical protein